MKLQMKKTTFDILKIWLPIALTTTFLCFIIEVVIQQNYRSSANDPQIQMVEDAVISLKNGRSPASAVASYTTVDVKNSLSPFIEIFDKGKKPVVSTGLYDGQMPTFPEGVLTHTHEWGQNKVTWQPENGVRSAIVANVVWDENNYVKYYVVAGRSLKEVEKRVSNLDKMILSGWLITVIFTLLAVTTLEKVSRKRSINLNLV